MTENKGLNHPISYPIEVAKFLDNFKIEVDSQALENLFLNENVKDRKIVAFSIVGAFRKGKSFFLNYCLRFLYAHYQSLKNANFQIENADNWIGAEDEPLTGFSTSSGKNRDTTGIVIWNDVFLYTNPKTRQKIAIVVIDTQGLFDSETLQVDNSRIFALSTLISSIQVLNLTGLIQEDQLQYLQFATEFALYATDKTTSKAFQTLIFLIRDWVFDEHDFGFEGGLEYLNAMLEIKPVQKDELKSLRQYIRSSFDEIGCCLFPHPGDKVAGRRRAKIPYDGNWREMDEEFKAELIKLIEHLLLPEKLVVKKVNGNELNGQEFYQYAQEYFFHFQSDEMPQVQNIFESLIEKHMAIVIDKCLQRYKVVVYSHHEKMENIEQILMLNEAAKKEGLIAYEEEKKMGDDELQEKFRQKLIDQMDSMFKNEWGNQAEINIEKLEFEKQQAIKAIQEKENVQLELEENARKTAQELLEMKRLEIERNENYNKQLREHEIETERLLSEQEAIKAQKLLELEGLVSQKKIDQEIYESEREIAEQKHKDMLARIQAELEKELNKIENEEKLKHEKYLKEIEVAEELLKKEQSEVARLQAEKERDAAINKELEATLNSKRFEASYIYEEKKLYWKTGLSIYSSIPTEDIIRAGYDSDEEPLYVGRALHNGVQIPGKVYMSSRKTQCVITLDGMEILKTRFEVPVGAHSWVKNDNSGIPGRATVAGTTEDNQKMYIGRAKHNGNYIPGMVLENADYCSITYNGEEIKKDEFEFLLWE